MPEPLTNALAETLQVGVVQAIMETSTALALVASIGLLWLYRRAVLRSMRARTGSTTSEPMPSVTPKTSTPPNRPAQETAPDFLPLDGAPPAAIGPAAEALYSRLLRSPWRAAAIYAGAGFCFALVMAAASLTSQEIWSTSYYSSLIRFLFLFWTYAWPVVLTVTIVAAATWRARIAVTSGYFLVLAAIGVVTVARSPVLLTPIDFGSIILFVTLLGGLELPSFQVPQLAFIWLAINLVVTGLVLAFLYRRIRAVGPLVLAFMVISVAGSYFAAPIALYSNEVLARALDDVGRVLGYGLTLRALGVLGFAVAALLVGWVALLWLRRRYERKKASDQSITLDAIWLVYAVHQSLDMSFEGPAWMLSGLIAFAAYKAAAWAGFRLLGPKAPPGENARLLVLRVFSLGKRGERLFDAVARHWRHVGDIRLIAGPDLATATVEPHEFLDFLVGRLSRRFIDSREKLDLRLSEMDLKPDGDGRYRVNDFFCHDDAWRKTLSRLVEDTDVVLMDLRGFSRTNAGVVYEVGELIDVVPLERVVFVVDGTTDEAFLRETARAAWDRMSPCSPNRSPATAQIRLFRFTRTRGGELRRLLGVLLGAARAPASAEASGPAPVRWPLPAALFVLFAFLVVVVNVGSAAFSRELLFSDGFSAGTDWPEHRGRNYGHHYGSSEFSADKSSFHMYASPGWAVTQLAPEARGVKDVSVSVNAVLTSGQPNSTAAGVVCRAQDYENYYVLAVYYVGYATIQKVEDGGYKELVGANYAETIGGNNTIGGKETLATIRGDCVGDKLTLYVAEQNVAEAEDSEFGEGKVGLFWNNAASEHATRAEGSFDEFMVWAP